MRSTMSDSSRPHELPLASIPVASDGHTNDGRRGSNAETTSKNRAIGQSCRKCNVSLEKKPRSSYRRSNDELYCTKCYYRLRYESSQHESDPDSDEESDSDSEPMSQDEEKTTLSIDFSFNDHKKCIFRTCIVNSTTRIKDDARCQVLRLKRIFIPKGARCCSSHLAGRLFRAEALDQIPTKVQTAQFKTSQIEEMIKLLINKQTDLNEFDSMDSKTLKVYTGRGREEFDELSRQLLVTSKFETKRSTILGVYLTRLYAGFTQEQISVTFKIPQRTVSDYIKRCRSNLQQFVSINVGLNVLNRSRMLEHRTNNVEVLYNLSGTQSVVTVWDATYEYLPKSSNFRFQAATYSANKKRNLLKPMVAVTPDGMIVDIFGPDTLWKASESDADILKHLMQLDSFQETFRAGDVFVLDRGFRNVKQALEEKNYVVKIPPHLVKGQKQLTTIQANQQRDCTAIRWIVEVVNRQLKCNKYLASCNGVQAVPYLLEDTRIAAAIYNRFGSRIVAYHDDARVATTIRNRFYLENHLKTFVDQKNMTRLRTMFRTMNGEDIPEFPEMNPVGLRTMIGSYHLSLATSYYGDHIYQQEGYEIQILKDESFSVEDFQQYRLEVERPLFLRIKLQSRFSRHKIYQAYLLCDTNKSGTDSIIGFCCQCLQGLRTVSPCAHVSSVIWFLGFGRNQEQIKTPSEFLNNHFPAGGPVAESENEED